VRGVARVALVTSDRDSDGRARQLAGICKWILVIARTGELIRRTEQDRRLHGQGGAKRGVVCIQSLFGRPCLFEEWLKSAVERLLLELRQDFDDTASAAQLAGIARRIRRLTDPF